MLLTNRRFRTFWYQTSLITSHIVMTSLNRLWNHPLPTHNNTHNNNTNNLPSRLMHTLVHTKEFARLNNRCSLAVKSPNNHHNCGAILCCLPAAPEFGKDDNECRDNWERRRPTGSWSLERNKRWTLFRIKKRRAMNAVSGHRWTLAGNRKRKTSAMRCLKTQDKR